MPSRATGRNWRLEVLAWAAAIALVAAALLLSRGHETETPPPAGGEEAPASVPVDAHETPASAGEAASLDVS